MPVTSPLDQVRTRTADLAGDPFLLSVTADGAPHSAPVTVSWEGDRLRVPVPRGWPGAPADAPRPVSLLYPPDERGGYALIVDGRAVDDAGTLLVTLTRAVLHRRGRPTRPDATCGSDCVPLFPAPAA